MYWHIILTEKCNSKCRYCYEKSMKEFDNGLDKKFSFDFSSPCDFSVHVVKLKKFIEQDKNPVIVFYGGEPLLQIEKIKEIMDLINARFCMQTNGKLLDKLPEKYIKRFSRILVSIDGDKERTDINRGKGTFELITKNIKLIRKKGFKGEIVARMTIASDCPDLFKQVKNILSLNLFDSVHWQIDAGFYKEDFDKIKHKSFFKEYNENVSQLVLFWLEEIKNGKVLKFYPFLGIFESLYYNRKTKLRCGAGYAGYAITTDGKIAACPIMNNIKDFYCGTVDSKLNEIKKIEVTEPCISCEIKDLCGGRCLYSNYSKLWPKEGQDLVCFSVKHLIQEITNVLPEIKLAIFNKKVLERDFEYEKYFGPEIIP